MKPYYERENITLYQGDSLQIIPSLEPATVSAVITDPPYSSGGMWQGTRSMPPEAKYCQDGKTLGRPTFSGDNRDGRSWAFWCSLWISECRRLLTDGGYFLSFIDWRMLPLCTDAVQAGGLVWRGLIAWDKGRGARAPHKGYFKHQCEYVVWASNGPLRKAVHAGPFDGCHHYPVLQTDKHHMTGKPTALLEQLVGCVPAGGLILDPFAGSSTTAVACVRKGLRFVGIEQEEAYCEISARRLDAEFGQGRLAA
ncbi:DNA-methyltransferase [Zavarzinella formosa]|uniref:DNA-methyltransferase n=1 Tax=Zavarzinella formosa TaxID=360055 RepID=UPI000304251B|nr:site-specific DNA-methyltransferase [Zavarzinella formosa]